MAEFLFVRPTVADTPNEVEWVAVDDTGALLAPPAGGTLADVAPLAVGKRVVFLAPAADVMTTRVVLPAASPARMRQMLPFSLEDVLADDVDDLAFAVGARDGGTVTAAVVAKERLEGWLASLAAAEIVPAALYSEADGVPETAGAVTVVLEDSRAMCRRAGEPPLAFEGLDLASVLELVLPPPAAHGENAEAGDEEPAEPDAAPDASEPEAIDKVVVYFDETAGELHAQDLARLGELEAQAEKRLMADGTLPHLAATLVQRPGTNLLQGAYAPKSNWAALARPWQLAASLAGVALALAVLLQVANYVSLRRDDALLTAAIGTECRRLVGTDRLNACRTEVQSRLRSLGGGGGQDVFLPMMVTVAESLAPGMRLTTLQFRNGLLDLEVPNASVDAMERFRQAVGESQRFTARIESHSTESSRVQIQERSL